MNFFLNQRSASLAESMDDPSCDKQKLFKTYHQFVHLNRWISRWRGLFDTYILPLACQSAPVRILDIGCGGGDLCLMFSERAKRKGVDVHLTGIDPDPRAHEYRRSLEIPDNVEFRCIRTESLLSDAETFDVVLSNHLIHHLKYPELLELFRHADHLAEHLVLFNDIRRSDLGYAAFALTAPLIYHSSFIVKDGLISIRRSYTEQELTEILPREWDLQTLFPFRLLVMMRKGEGC